MTPEEAVQEYQCSGCVSGPFPDCYIPDGTPGCTKHYAGTIIMPIPGRIFPTSGGRKINEQIKGLQIW